jgi:Dynein heavy chain.
MARNSTGQKCGETWWLKPRTLAVCDGYVVSIPEPKLFRLRDQRDFSVLSQQDNQSIFYSIYFSQAPRDGAYVNGLYMEGARWDIALGVISDAKLKELFPMMPVIYIKVKEN